MAHRIRFDIGSRVKAKDGIEDANLPRCAGNVTRKETAYLDGNIGFAYLVQLTIEWDNGRTITYGDGGVGDKYLYMLETIET